MSERAHPPQPNLSSPTSDRGSRLNPGAVPHLERGGRQKESRGGRQADAVLHLKRDELRPEVRSYIDNLKAQVLLLLKQHDVKDVAEFERLVSEKKVKAEDVQKMKELLEKFARTARTGEAPELKEEKYKLAESLLESAAELVDEIDKESSYYAVVVLEKIAVAQYEAGFDPTDTLERCGKLCSDGNNFTLNDRAKADTHHAIALSKTGRDPMPAIEDAERQLTPHSGISQYDEFLFIAQALAAARDRISKGIMQSRFDRLRSEVDKNTRSDRGLLSGRYCEVAELEIQAGLDPRKSLELAEMFAQDILASLSFSKAQTYCRIASLKRAAGLDPASALHIARLQAVSAHPTDRCEIYIDLIPLIEQTGFDASTELAALNAITKSATTHPDNKVRLLISMLERDWLSFGDPADLLERAEQAVAEIKDAATRAVLRAALVPHAVRIGQDSELLLVQARDDEFNNHYLNEHNEIVREVALAEVYTGKDPRTRFKQAEREIIDSDELDVDDLFQTAKYEIDAALVILGKTSLK